MKRFGSETPIFMITNGKAQQAPVAYQMKKMGCDWHMSYQSADTSLKKCRLCQPPDEIDKHVFPKYKKTLSNYLHRI
jgi:hypothetical protein